MLIEFLAGYADQFILGAIAILILFIAYLLTHLTSGMLKRAGETLKMSRDSRKSAAWIINLLIYTVASIMALYALGFDVSTLLAGVGILALAVGFAAQQLLSNIIAGFLIITEKPFRIGDHISFDGRTGWVENIGLRATRISTYDGNSVVVPNSELVNSSLVNFTDGGRQSEISVSFILQPDDDFKKLSEAATKLCKESDMILTDQRHEVRVLVSPIEKLGAQRYMMEVLFWIKDSRMEKDAITHLSLGMKRLLPR